MHQSLRVALERIVRIISPSGVCAALGFEGVKPLAKLGSAPAGIYAHA